MKKILVIYVDTSLNNLVNEAVEEKMLRDLLQELHDHRFLHEKDPFVRTCGYVQAVEELP